MATQSPFQPTPPIRTSTVNSEHTQSSGQMSPLLSPTSPSRAGTAGATTISPTEESFFSAITARLRSASHKRDKSHMAMPPDRLPSTTTQQQSQPHQQDQHAVKSTQQERPSLQRENRRSTSGSDPWRGRHSNEWLFGGFSVTDTARGILKGGKKG